jgi:sugar phosphate isomerase/epimerase
MKLCVVSESLGHLTFPDAAKVAADLGLAALEIGTGNWNTAPHAKLQSLLESKEERRKFLAVLEQNGLSLAALNCNGNQLHPTDGERQSKIIYDTVRVVDGLRLNGYDGWLSIEHEDVVLSRMEGVRRSVDLLRRTMIDEPSD